MVLRNERVPGRKISPHPDTPKSWRALLLLLVEFGIICPACYPQIVLLELFHVLQHLPLLLLPLLGKQRPLLLVLFHLFHNVPSSSRSEQYRRALETHIHVSLLQPPPKSPPKWEVSRDNWTSAPYTSLLFMSPDQSPSHVSSVMRRLPSPLPSSPS